MSKLKVLTKFTNPMDAPYHEPTCTNDSPCSIGRGRLDMHDAGQSMSSTRKSSFARKNAGRIADAENTCQYCSNSKSSSAPPTPAKWPQHPILLRPSPDSGMKILGIRHSSSKEYLAISKFGYCEGCTLPVNNGHEQPGECLVVDFESEIFIGTLLLRVRDISSALPRSGNKEATYSDANKHYYFNKKRRTFQAVVKGRFKKHGIPMSECITGQVFNRPAGYLPPRLIVKGAVSIISRLAPQLQARLEGDCPRFLSPLVSVAQTVLTNPSNKDSATEERSIEDNLCEPQASHQSSIIQSIRTSGAGEFIGISSTSSENAPVTFRIKTRKRAFEKLYARSIKTPTFDPDLEYTFEFFQHLITFDDFCLDFVKPIGKHSLHGMLNGQPLKFMSAHQTAFEGKEALDWLWCFDLWHESLYEDALIASEEETDHRKFK